MEVIDDDLGRSASGTVARPGFERLVANLCGGEVGAVFCFDASRLSRNGRDWHHLLELCGLVGARVIDLDGVYDPCRPNDRLLLGMKGSISEFELGVLRSRMLDAARSKARRGELRIPVPIGYVWHREIGLGLDPDLRVQEVTRGIFQRFRELGSARQVHLALKVEGVHFPRGTALATAVVSAVIEEMQRIDAPRLAAEQGAYLRAQVAALPGVAGVRGEGLLLAAELDEGRDAKALYADLMERGLVTNAVTGTALRLAPPLTVSLEHIDEAVAMIAAALA